MASTQLKPPQHSLIIAEAGVNHNGDLSMALRLVDAAKAAGADVVKFQTFQAAKLATAASHKADYQKRNTGDAGSQVAMLRQLELDVPSHHKILERCRALGIEFMSTPFDIDSLHMLVDELDVSKIKISSGDITNAPLLVAAAQTGRPVILSTGMSDLTDIERALGYLAYGYLHRNRRPDSGDFKSAYRSPDGFAVLQKNVVLLHCTTEYPAPYSEVNLQVMRTLAGAFHLPIGYSDHTKGIAIPSAAAALGAIVIEKHFTLDSTLPGPDHRASLEPQELQAMVTAIRQIEQARGDGRKVPSPSEIKNSDVARRTLVADRAINAGEPFDATNIGVKRCPGGLEPERYWSILGKQAGRAYKEGEAIDGKVEA